MIYAAKMTGFYYDDGEHMKYLNSRTHITLLSACIAMLLFFTGCSGETGMQNTKNTDAVQLQVTGHAATDAPAASIEQTASVTVSPTLMTAVPQPTAVPTAQPTARATATPTARPSSLGNRLAGLKIGIDAGHQDNIDYGKEPIAPGSSILKIKATVGTAGVVSRTPEYVVNLSIALKLQKLLEAEGATVVMTRTTNSVNLSNKDRAEIFNEAKTDLAIRIHCNGMTDQSLHGAFVIQPADNPFLEECQRAAKIIIEEYVKETGFYNKGVYTFDNQTGFNWCERAIICIEMGHLSNAQDDKKLNDADMQEKMAEGIFQGIVRCYEN